MPSSPQPTRTTFTRPAPDLVATDELLNSLLLGLAHLRRRLEVARGPNKGSSVDGANSNSSSPFGSEKRSADAVVTPDASEKRWYYANEALATRD